MLLIVSAFVPTVQVRVRSEVCPLVTLPKASGLGVHVSEGVTTALPPPMAKIWLVTVE